MKQFFCLVLILTLVDCTQNAEQPENLVSEDKMVSILSDIYLYQQTTYLQEIKNNEPDFAKIDAQLIKKHGVEIRDFKESYRFYVLHPEKLNEIFTRVRNQLEQRLPENERKKRIGERKKSEKKK